MKFDVAIVGGGPSGAIAGKYAAMHGAKTVIIEEHPAIGEPVQCAGIVSTRAVAACELDRGNFLIRSVQGAFVNAFHHRLKIDGHSEKAWIVDRRLFDRELVDHAMDAGCALFLRSKVLNSSRGRLELRISGEREFIEADVIIAAEGVSRKITRSYLGASNLPKIIPGIQAEVSCEFEDSRFVELFLGES
ncbi:NAD(P)/FAD-dependent oxidoreductase, partial [Methanosarcinales archaeon]